ncbi:hypothetical protein FisN_4Lh423 [Fistulifera solaris]|uniref:HMG box domain-containing protein n=1 Tax=Fistulifera solaris TaxID=1519565 RepID=A0A1Z5KDH1_FISSO|nr:hypothetical protein FisN_4Lh423 [Fistulifera solaris]|eukprot:GAX24309.1 hypothetical protein FisN_4Lh423 [Fistulifera solaris]
MKDELDLKSKDKLPLPSKRPSKKKPKDKPKRPLSAYNFFFKEEREKILKVVLADDPEKVDNNPESEDYLDEEMLKRLRKEGGKVSFEEMGKLIGQRWKNIEGDNLTRFSEMATEDTERYKKEMAEYNGRQEQKMRNEALKPSAPAFSRADMSKGHMMDPSRGGYPDGSGFGNPAMGGYPGYGMGFGYGMGMEGMYPPPYGGYPGMGGPMGPDMGRMEGGQYGGPPPMYGMMGGYPMGYGPGPEGYGPPPPGQQPPPMDPSGGPPPMYGYGPPSGWGHQ